MTIEMETAPALRMVDCLEGACQQRGWGVQLFNARGDGQLEAHNLSRIASSGLAAAVIFPADNSDNVETLVRLKLDGFPMVLVDRSVPGLKVDAVEVDYERGAYLATEHLLHHGHRRVWMVTQKPVLISVAARLRGYEQALFDAGLEARRAWKVWIDGAVASQGGREGKPWLGGYAAVLPLLRNLELPVAAFAHNAYSGWGVFQACRELGLRIPDDVSIVCFDDPEFTQALAPPMSAIRRNTDEIVSAAVELLEQRLLGQTLLDPQHKLVDVELISRGSVAKVR